MYEVLKKMIQINKLSDCCGCTACKSICTHDAITMVADALGFLYPEVNKDKCVECGLCEKVCAFNSHYDTNLNLEEPLAYAVRHKNITEVNTSRSGAAFIAFSDWILEQGGIVYGAGYTPHFRVIHKRATTKEERDEFKGSKYVQSDMNTIFHQVKNDLKNGLLVLFSGTPCQTSGLSSYVGSKLRKKLYLIDIVCHGVPSPAVWHSYLDYVENKHGHTITKVNFRDKDKFGWGDHKESFNLGDKYVSAYTYTALFYKNLMLRPACGRCYFTNFHRPSDATLADFWGWEKVDKELNSDNKGISLLLINTQKGKEWFDHIGESINSIKITVAQCLQPQLEKPTELSPLSEKFEKDFFQHGFLYVSRKYIKTNWKMRLRSTLKKCIVKIFYN